MSIHEGKANSVVYTDSGIGVSLQNTALLFSFFLFWHFGAASLVMERPRLGVESELQPQAYTTVTESGIQATCVTYTKAHGNT